jgi:hypothetical protein
MHPLLERPEHLSVGADDLDVALGAEDLARVMHVGVPARALLEP